MPEFTGQAGTARPVSGAAVHPTAIVDPRAILGAGVTVGPLTVVRGDARIGAGSRIGSHCVIGEGDRELTSIGAGALIRSHSVIYAGSTFGRGLETGHHAVLREGLDAGRGLRVGTASDLQGLSTIGHFVRIHSNVFVAQRTTIEDFAWIFPKVMLADDPHPPSDTCTHGPTIRSAAVIGAAATVLPGLDVGRASLVAASALVTADVPEEAVVRGAPARVVGSTRDVRCRHGALGRPYPWWEHFRRGYPPEVRWTGQGPVYQEEDDP
jgi:acetyltransferase-like isoleucine patch superfamily enzyme